MYLFIYEKKNFFQKNGHFWGIFSERSEENALSERSEDQALSERSEDLPEDYTTRDIKDTCRAKRGYGTRGNQGPLWVGRLLINIYI